MNNYPEGVHESDFYDDEHAEENRYLAELAEEAALDRYYDDLADRAIATRHKEQPQ